MGKGDVGGAGGAGKSFSFVHCDGLCARHPDLKQWTVTIV
jgi:hypothetical protein